MITVNDIQCILEELAPLSDQESWDNAGLLVGKKEKEVKRILIALDASKEVIAQAVEKRVDLLITHHPILFSSVKQITTENFLGEKVLCLAEHQIACYAMHTNFDCFGMAQEAAGRLPFSQQFIFCPGKEQNKGIGRYGMLQQEMTLKELACLVKKQFHLPYITVVGDLEKMVQNVAIVPGSGKSMRQRAVALGLDVLITGDIDHHTALDAKDQGLAILDAGHFGIEHCMVDYVKQYLERSIQKRQLSGLELLTAKESSPFQIIIK